MAEIGSDAHAWVLGYGSDFPDPAEGLLEPFFREGSWLYRDAQLEQLLARATAAPTRMSACTRAASSKQDRIAEQAAVVPLAYGNRTCGDARG